MPLDRKDQKGVWRKVLHTLDDAIQLQEEVEMSDLDPPDHHRPPSHGRVPCQLR